MKKCLGLLVVVKFSLTIVVACHEFVFKHYHRNILV